MDTQTTPPEVDYSKKWHAMAAVGIGVLLATIDGSIVNIALPTIRQELSTTLPMVQWVSIGYLLTLATLVLGVGRWGDIVGKKRIYVTGIISFTVASMLCGLAPSIEALIAFRIIQAVGASMSIALGAAIITEAFPPSERGRALGTIGTFVSVGVITGPMLGGILISAWDWRAIFFVNLPVGILGAILSLKFVPNTPPKKGQRFDLVGAALMSASLLFISLAVTLGQHDGFGSARILIFLTTGLVLTVVFVFYEFRVDWPMLEPRLFKNPALSVGVLNGFLVFVCTSSTAFLLPFFLQGVVGFSPRTTGLALGMTPLALGVVAPFAGALSDRIGVRRISNTGIVFLIAAFLGFLSFGSHTSFAGFALVAIPLGFGIGVFQSPNNSAIMGSMPHEYIGVGGALMSLTRLLGQITGIAILSSLWAIRVAARNGGLVGDAIDAPDEVQVAALHDLALLIVVVLVGALAIGVYGMRREVRPSGPGSR